MENLDQEIDKLNEALQDKSDRIEELMHQLEKAAENSQHKKQLEDYKEQMALNLKKVAEKVIENKTREQQFLDVFMETEDADSSEDLAKLNKIDKETYLNFILDLLKEETEILDEVDEEIKAMMNAKKVLLAEKTRLLEKT